MLEIQRLESGISSLFGNRVHINLNDYAEKDSIKCKIANIGEEIIPDMFSYSGNPYFPYETFMKYSNGEHYARVYVEVEYKSKELELDEFVFNTAKGIDDYIVDLETLHHIMNIRSIAKNKKNIRLNEFVWKSILKFDEFGQTMFIFEQEFSEDTPDWVRNGTVNTNTFNRCCKRWCGTFKNIPDQDDICPVCGNKWTIDNISDYVTVEQKDYKQIGYHKDCLKIHNNNEQLKEFQDIFKSVYDLDELKFTMIPNQYCPCEHCASWFIVSTPNGDIKIGWRKRVINIEWLENYKVFKEMFESEDVTKGFGQYGDSGRSIHAWSVDKAAEYLNRAKQSIL